MNYVKKEESPIIPLKSKRRFVITFQKSTTNHDARTLGKIASIDIGSNTLRLLIAEKSAQGFYPLCRDREIVRLGRNFYPDRFLSARAIESAVKVLKRFKIRADHEGVTNIFAVGTGVLREAQNIAIFFRPDRKGNPSTGADYLGSGRGPTHG